MESSTSSQSNPRRISPAGTTYLIHTVDTCLPLVGPMPLWDVRCYSYSAASLHVFLASYIIGVDNVRTKIRQTSFAQRSILLLHKTAPIGAIHNMKVFNTSSFPINAIYRVRTYETKPTQLMIATPQSGSNHSHAKNVKLLQWTQTSITNRYRTYIDAHDYISGSANRQSYMHHQTDGLLFQS